MRIVAIYIYSHEQTYVKPCLLFLNFVGSRLFWVNSFFPDYS